MGNICGGDEKPPQLYQPTPMDLKRFDDLQLDLSKFIHHHVAKNINDDYKLGKIIQNSKTT